jgi:transposase
MFVSLIFSSSNRVCLALLSKKFKSKVMKDQTKKKGVVSNDEFRLAIIQHQSGAIDVGSTMMMVSYADKNGEHHLLETSAYTDDLEGLARTLQTAGVQYVAMEATGVYWMALYELLEHSAIEVTLVNPQHFKNVAGQKTDVKDCQWLHQLQAHGLLRPSHIAPEVYRELRDYIHERNILQKQKSDTLNRIQKLLTRMNIKVQHLISDIEGVSGMRLLRGIAEGINDAEELLSLIDVQRLKADKTDLVKSLKGNYKIQYICILKRTLKAYDFFKAQMREYEELIEEVLIKMLPKDVQHGDPKIRVKTSHVRKNQYSINVKDYLQHITGIDLTRIDGMDEISILEIISVTGLDMKKWPTENHFTSWLNLSPRPKKSGGKIIGYQQRFTKNQATQCFRLAAQTMWKNKGSLGQLYRRLAYQKGSKKAIKALARKLAVIFYCMLKNKTEYEVDKLQIDTEKHKLIKIARLKKEAAKYWLIFKESAA